MQKKYIRISQTQRDLCVMQRKRRVRRLHYCYADRSKNETHKRIVGGPNGHVVAEGATLELDAAASLAKTINQPVRHPASFAELLSSMMLECR